MKNVHKRLAKGVLTPQGLTATASATDTVIQKEIHCSGTRTVITLNKEMKNIIKVVKSLEESELLIKCVSETIGNEAK